ncbi:uncharacterized protein LOC142973239 [Anticarsia gemmatalis]|uniref:uncharacterized protein LOC142973239 n=1 Tax=Anticarsia gemmatalis TaxID=129554 RepID=UPI003F777EBE
MLGQVVLVFVLVWVLLQRWQKRKMIQVSRQFASANHIALPFVGHAYIFLGSDEDRMNEFQKLGREAIANDGVVTLWQGPRLYLVIADPVNAEFILKNCLEKDDTMKCLRMLTGNGSVFAPVNIWRPRRKVLAPTFSPKNLMQFTEIFSRQSIIMVDQLKAAAGRGDFSIWKYITTYSMDSVCESTLGVKVNAQKQSEQPFLKSFEVSTQLDSARLCQPWLHSEAVYKMTPAYKKHNKSRNIICEFIDQIIKSKRLSMKEEKETMPESDHNIKRESLRTFLEMLIESSGGERGYSDIELQEETLVLVIAGTDTSAVGTAFTSVLLSTHQDVQEKVYRELREVFGDSNRPVVAEDLPRLKYLEAVIKESLRLYPSVPIIVRKVDKEVTLPSGVTLAKETGLVIHIWAIHRNPQYWGEDAEQFRPERFIDTPLSHPAAFIPFSHGPRACIGYKYAMMSMKTALASLLRQYKIQPASTYSDKHKPLRLKFDVMLRDADEFTVQLETKYIMLVECLFVSVIVLFVYQRWKNNDIYKLGKQLDSKVTALPLVGHSYLFLGSSETRMKAFQTLGRDAIKKESGLTSFWLGNHLNTMIADPVCAEFVLKTCLQKDDIMKMARLFIGNGSIFAPVSIWKPRRKVLITTFSSKNMKYFLSIFTRESQVLVEQLKKVVGIGTVSAWKYFTAYTMDAIAEASLGYKMHSQKDSGHPFLKSFDEGLSHCAERLCSPWLHNDFVYENLPVYKKLLDMKDYMWGFVKELIKSKRKEIQEEELNTNESDKEDNPKSFLELLIKSSGGDDGYSDIEVIEEVMMIMVAGNDTSAVGSSFISLILSRYPEVQEKVYQELQEVFGDSDRVPTFDDLLRLKYLDAVIRETLRLYPPVPIITRKVEREVVIPSGLKLLPGTGIIVNIWALHRNPRYWGDDAEQFRPERFIDTPLTHPAAFMPFSHGPRNCIGYQFAMTSMKTVMSTVLRRYKILPATKPVNAQHPPLRLKFDLMMKDVDDFQLQLERRNK